MVYGWVDGEEGGDEFLLVGGGDYQRGAAFQDFFVGECYCQPLG